MKRIVLVAVVAAIVATVSQSALAANGGLAARAQSVAANEAGHGALVAPPLGSSGTLMIAGEPKYEAPFTDAVAGSPASSGLDWIEITLVAIAVLFVGALVLGVIRLGHASVAKPVA